MPHYFMGTSLGIGPFQGVIIARPDFGRIGDRDTSTHVHIRFLRRRQGFGISLCRKSRYAAYAISAFSFGHLEPYEPSNKYRRTAEAGP
jgi:hypothetical protein